MNKRGTVCTHLFPSLDGDVDVFEHQVQVVSVTQAEVPEFHSAHLGPGAGGSHLLNPPGSLRMVGWGLNKESESTSHAPRLHHPSNLTSLSLAHATSHNDVKAAPQRQDTHTSCCWAFAPSSAWTALPQTIHSACSLSSCRPQVDSDLPLSPAPLSPHPCFTLLPF